MLDDVDVTELDGIPVTSVARTLLDLGAVLPATKVIQVTQDALLAGSVSATSVLGALERVGSRAGTAPVRQAMVERLSDRAESRLEVDLVRLVGRLQGPPPVLQYELDTPSGSKLRLAWPGRPDAWRSRPTGADGIRRRPISNVT